jgi:hypothetical protein
MSVVAFGIRAYVHHSNLKKRRIINQALRFDFGAPVFSLYVSCDHLTPAPRARRQFQSSSPPVALFAFSRLTVNSPISKPKPGFTAEAGETWRKTQEKPPPGAAVPHVCFHGDSSILACANGLEVTWFLEMALSRCTISRLILRRKCPTL